MQHDSNDGEFKDAPVLRYLGHGEVSGEQVNEFKKEAGWQEGLREYRCCRM